MDTAFKIKPQEGETTRHDDTRAVSGGLLRLIYDMLKEILKFSVYFFSNSYSPPLQTDIHSLYPQQRLS
jgi:hypothetical protein